MRRTDFLIRSTKASQKFPSKIIQSEKEFLTIPKKTTSNFKSTTRTVFKIPTTMRVKV